MLGSTTSSLAPCVRNHHGFNVGLDGLEFLMAVEEAVQMAIPDDEAQRTPTPGDLVRYVLARLGARENPTGCLEQRAFYRLRRAIIQVFATPRSAVVPATPWVDLLPHRQVRHNWHLLHQAAGTRRQARHTGLA